MTTRRAFSSAVFLLHEGKILLVLHKRFNLWLPVGGELEPGETPLEAAIRETREETGIVLGEGQFENCSYGEPPGFFCYEEHDAGSKGLHMNFNFAARAESENVKLCDEHNAFRWYNIAQITERRLMGFRLIDTTDNVYWCLQKIHDLGFDLQLR